MGDTEKLTFEPGQVALLLALNHYKGRISREDAVKFIRSVDDKSPGALIINLIERGYVTGKKNKRGVTCSLTREGYAVLAQMNEDCSEYVSRIHEAISINFNDPGEELREYLLSELVEDE
jgi:hypothetical protein